MSECHSEARGESWWGEEILWPLARLDVMNGAEATPRTLLKCQKVGVKRSAVYGADMICGFGTCSLARVLV